MKNRQNRIGTLTRLFISLITLGLFLSAAQEAAAYYSPEQGRFLSRDPIHYADGPHLYAYVGGQPLIKLDPSGEYTWDDAATRLARSRAGRGATTRRVTVVRGELSAAEIFRKWLSLERERIEDDGAWWDELPKCPCRIEIECAEHFRDMPLGAGRMVETREPVNPDPAKWQNPDEPTRAEESLHPGIKFSMRSLESENGHFNQCTYNARGRLFTEPPQAGTVDWKEATMKNFRHYNHDVKPVIEANILDGGDRINVFNILPSAWRDKMKLEPGEHVLQYYEVRPTWHEDCPRNP